MTPDQAVRSEIDSINERLITLMQSNAETYDLMNRLLQGIEDWKASLTKGLQDAMYRLTEQGEQFADNACKLLERVSELDARIEAIEQRLENLEMGFSS